MRGQPELHTETISLTTIGQNFQEEKVLTLGLGSQRRREERTLSFQVPIPSSESEE